MNSVEYLLLDAKQAILDEQHRRFEELRQDGKLTEAMQQFQTTMSCASDVLYESLRMLERILDARQPAVPDAPPNESSPAR